MGLQHMLDLRGEKDGFVNVNSIYLIVDSSIDCVPEGFTFYFALFLHVFLQ